MEVRAAPPSDSVTSCESSESESESESPVAEGDPRVEDVMLAVLLLAWPVAEEIAAVPVEEVMLMESVLVMLMEDSDSVSLAVMELSVMEEAADEDMEELALGAALLSLSMTFEFWLALLSSMSSNTVRLTKGGV